MSNFFNRIMMTAMTFAVMATACSDNSGNSDSGKTTTEKMTTTISAGTSDISEPAEENEKTETSTKSSEIQSLPVKKTSNSELFSDRDLNPDYSQITAEIILNGKSAEVKGNGVSVKGSTVTITDEGIYHITGTLDDGQIIVDAEKNKVQLVLDNAEINCSNSSAVYIVSAKKTFITLADGSKNIISDGSEYEYADSSQDEPDSAVFSHDSLTINGTGELEVNGNYNDGIRSKDDVVITDGKITVNAAGDAIKGKDYVAVADGDINLTSGKHGINASNTAEDAEGFVYIEGGNFNITSGGGSSESTKTHTDDFGGGFGGGGMGHGGGFGKGGGFNKDDIPEDFGDFNPEDFENFNPEDFMPNGMPDENFEQQNLAYTADTESTDNTENTVSPKGIKAVGEINIVGGTFNINSADDSVHSDSDVVISGGTINIDSGNKGIHADATASINGGAVNITKSYEGIEATVINVTDGKVEIVASDDGFNSSDGVTDQSGMGTYSNDIELNISGGFVYVSADGDGLDSNGNINITGGTVIVNGPENSGNGALDSNGEIIINGGTVVAVGMSGMAESPTESSAQNCVSATFDSTYEGGTLVTLLDDSGNEIMSFAPEKSFDNIIISSPDIKTGTAYTFYTGGTSSKSETRGLYENGGYNNDGTESGNFTAESSVSYVGKQSMMGGGGMGHGGGGGMHGGMNKGGDFDFSELPDDMPEPLDMNGGRDFKQPRQ
ncbi:MAG: carbohydrate-binding domain-containing protein [Ruminococcus flavefaciens]|nr:carbohydrate-binding domain-containing protein [Ruminococcus flavefaciens]